MSQKVLTFGWSAAGTQNWTADADYILDAIRHSNVGSVGALVVSTDPTLTIANMIAANQMIKDVIFYTEGSANVTQPSPAQLKVPINKDTKVFLVITGSTAVSQLFLSDAVDLT
jgi:hypothetical protein